MATIEYYCIHQHPLFRPKDNYSGIFNEKNGYGDCTTCAPNLIENQKCEGFPKDSEHKITFNTFEVYPLPHAEYLKKKINLNPPHSPESSY